ncbi:5,10-methylenetetrahydromethanopterin reductase [Tamaricihabitans halophyticus]|uniref:5,10-methylenetetrahydromethanopterin reductase n=1 Tax=Tamaricihabitans halophyticus TaxID=1262583 RepID=A0A4R2QGQ1_9PSEU|nr:LLM class flavin-dependent oxidoreductase [Tamaricihabitans halophyticus]TCP47879.1 5,10-methylenetetrahydromethanopterin reductase [Tamaricihabitans halophyticus]
MDRWGLSMGVSPREPLSRISELATAAENYGFDAMWFIDFQLGMKDVYAAMNLAALATDRMHVGAAVTNLVTRHPTVTANATAALDELSGGHAMLGLGAGWSSVYGAGGQPSKLGDLRAGIDEFRALFSGAEVDLYGSQIQLATATRQIPIYLAVSQPGMLRLAGEKCDGAILMGAADPEFCRWQLDYLNEGLANAGRDRAEVLVDLVVTMSVADDTETALGEVRAWATSQAATFDVWRQMPPAWERFRPEFAAARQGYHLVDHLSLRADHKQLVSDEFVRSVALVGNERECVERLRELAALDIDRITVALLSGGRMRRMAQLAEQIIPAVGGN